MFVVYVGILFGGWCCGLRLCCLRCCCCCGLVLVTVDLWTCLDGEVLIVLLLEFVCMVFVVLRWG